MIFSFPYESQLDAKDCGPACIKIISRYYGKFYSLNYLRDLCGITREGVSFLDISFPSEQIGLRSLSIKISWKEFIRLPFPCIVHWNNNHFIVVYNVRNNYVYVSDPV